MYPGVSRSTQASTQKSPRPHRKKICVFDGCPTTQSPTLHARKERVIRVYN